MCMKISRAFSTTLLILFRALRTREDECWFIVCRVSPDQLLW